jgi:hypothetical protein
MATVDLELNADLRKATQSFNKFGKKAGGSLDVLKSGFKSLAAVAVAAAGAYSVKKMVDAAAVQEQAVRSLNTALALTGDFSKENSKSFQEFASNLQQNSTIGDEVSLSMVGLAKSMGATNEQTKKIIQTAADMSAVTGDSLDVSVENLSKTLGGVAGRLAMTQTELKGMTAEQLKAGAGIDVLAKKYAGIAKEMTKTFAGASTQASNSFGDLLEEVGMMITKNPLVIMAINTMSKAFSELGAWISSNRQAVIDFSIDVVATLVKAFAFMINRVGDAVAIFGNLETILDFTIFKMADLAIGAVDVADTIVKAFKSAVNFGLQPLLSGVETVAGALNSLGIVSDESLASLQDGLKQISVDSDTSGLEAMRADVVAFRDAARDTFVESSDSLLETKDSFTESADAVSGFADSLIAMKTAGDAGAESLQKLSDANKETREEAKKTAATFQDTVFGKLGQTDITGKGVLAGGGALASGIAGGAQGANQLFTSGASMAADAFLPGAGAIAGPIAQLLAAGPEAAKAQVEAFVDQIPVIIDNLAEAMPVVAVALAKASPKVATAMAIALPIALAKSLPGALREMLKEAFEGLAFNSDKIFSDVGKGLSGLVMKFAEGLKNAFAEIFKSLERTFEVFYVELPKKVIQGLERVFKVLYVELPKKIFDGFKKLFDGLWNDVPQKIFDALSGLGQKILEPIQKFFEGLKPASLTGSAGGDALKNFQTFVSTGGLSGFKLASGGEVPAGFPNDNFPARLTSGENVVDRSTNEKLNAFLDGSGGGTKVVLQIGERQLAEVLLNLNRQGFRTA